MAGGSQELVSVEEVTGLAEVFVFVKALAVLAAASAYILKMLIETASLGFILLCLAAFFFLMFICAFVGGESPEAVSPPFVLFLICALLGLSCLAITGAEQEPFLLALEKDLKENPAWAWVVISLIITALQWLETGLLFRFLSEGPVEAPAECCSFLFLVELSLIHI